MQTQLSNWPKFVFALVAMLCMTILMVAGTVTADVGVPFLTAVSGYMLGNGIAAVKSQPQQPIFEPTDP